MGALAALAGPSLPHPALAFSVLCALFCLLLFHTPCVVLVTTSFFPGCNQAMVWELSAKLARCPAGAP